MGRLDALPAALVIALVGTALAVASRSSPVQSARSVPRPPVTRVSARAAQVPATEQLAAVEIAPRREQRALARTPTPILRPGSTPGGTPLASSAEFARSHQLDYLWFAGMVGTGHPWDFKPFGPYSAAGNFNYGAAGAAAGFSGDVLRKMAGIAQGVDHPSEPHHGFPGIPGISSTGTSPYWDRASSQQWIGLGIKYYEQYHTSGIAGPCGCGK